MLALSFLIESSSKLLVTRTGIKSRTSSISGLWFPWPIYMFFETGWCQVRLVDDLLEQAVGIKARTSLFSGRIRLLTLELLAFEWRNFYTSPRPVGQSCSNFMCSITGSGERLHNVLRQIGSKLWCLWQQKAPIDLKMGKWCLHLFSVAFYPILFILAGNDDMHKISDEFEFRPDRTNDYGVSCPWGIKHFP